jgi:hypothetical protein
LPGWSEVAPMDRREVVRSLAWILAAAATDACTPLRIVMRSFPADFKHDRDLVAQTLRAFTAAVIPGVDPSPGTTDPERVLLDRRYPFAKYAPFFAADLSRRAAQRFAGSAFASLGVAQRTAVIMEGLESDATTCKLYRGAIFLTQVAIYAGIYDGDAGCSLIDFHGRYRGGEISYTNPESFLPQSLTEQGNAA